MPKTKPFAELAARVNADPERRVRMQAYKHAMEDALALSELLVQRDLTRQMASGERDVTQASVFRIEHQEALYLSALSDYVAALGGELEVSAVFPDGKVTLVPVEG